MFITEPVTLQTEWKHELRTNLSANSASYMVDYGALMSEKVVSIVFRSTPVQTRQPSLTALLTTAMSYSTDSSPNQLHYDILHAIHIHPMSMYRHMHRTSTIGRRASSYGSRQRRRRANIQPPSAARELQFIPAGAFELLRGLSSDPLPEMCVG